MDASLILFQMWTEALKHVAENGRGNVIFLDGSPQGMEKTMQQMGALQAITRGNDTPPRTQRQ
jgi:prepilin-type processing-associated H-X9-DG protein